MLRSISRELHDEFGQILTAIGAMLARASKQDVPSSFRESLQEVREIAQVTLDKTRSLYQSLHPAILDDGGLEQALTWYLPVFEKQTGIKVQYQKTGTSPVVADGVAIHVYRVLQEALNNLAKHSKSSLAWVRVDFSPDRLHLEVEDRGPGVPPRERRAIFRPFHRGKEVTAGGVGLGLALAQRWARLLGGQLRLCNRAGNPGACFRIELPL